MNRLRQVCFAPAGPLVAALLAAACGQSPPTAAGADGVFATAPVDVAAIEKINPLGHMTTPFNVFPQGRIYFVLRNPAGTNAVRAPAAGTVTWILGPKPDFRVEVQVSPTVKWYVDHVTPNADVLVGGRVEAGAAFAVHSARTCCLDFGVLNTGRQPARFVNRARYSRETLDADAPLRFFAEPLRSQLYALVNRVGADRDGRHDFDEAGRLVGNWFVEGTPVAGSLLPDQWPGHLSFAYSNTHPDVVIISVGGTLALTNLFTVQDGAPDPATVTAASGIVVYRLFQKEPPVSEGNGRGTIQLGVMLVQVLDADRLRVEIFSGSAAAPPGFTAAARIYTR